MNSILKQDRSALCQQVSLHIASKRLSFSGLSTTRRMGTCLIPQTWLSTGEQRWASA